NNASAAAVDAVNSAKDSAITTINGLVTQATQARDAAQQAETNAGQSATSAANSADAADQSASEAATSEANATQQADRAETEANRAETEADNAETTAQDEVQTKRVEDDAFAFYLQQIAKDGIDDMPIPISLLPQRPDLENPLLNFSRSSAGGAFDSKGNFVTYPENEVRYYYDRETGIYKGRPIEGQRTRLNSNFTSLSSAETLSLTNQAYTVSFYGTGSVTLSGAHSDTLNGTGELERVTLTFTPSAGDVTFTPSGTVEFFQVQEGTVATTPIGNDGQAVTKDPDIATITDLSWYNQQEGTFVCEFEYNDTSTRIFDLDGIDLRSVGSGNLQFVIFGDTTETVTGGDRRGNNTIAAVSFSDNDSSLYINGNNVGTISNIIPKDLSTINLGSKGGRTSFLNGFIKSLIYYPKRLPNETLQQLTS